MHDGQVDMHIQDTAASRMSVITVCLNSAKTIRDTIDSVLAQDVEGTLEYIVIDGNSTDGTDDIVRGYGDSIAKFVCEPDDGISDAFNKGISKATGDIVGIINSDDVLLPGSVRQIIDYFAAHPGLDVIHGDALLYDGGRLIKQIKPAGRWWYPWRLVLYNHAATFVRRSVYEQFGQFDTSYSIDMDVEIFLRWLRNGVNICYLSMPLVAVQAGGLSGRRPFVGYREVRRALIVHRFPVIPATIQYVARYGVQAVVFLQEKLRSWKRTA